MALPRVPKSWLERLLGGSDYVYDGQTVQADEIELEGDGVELTKVSEGRVRLTISGGGGDVPEAGPEIAGTLAANDWQRINWRYLDYSAVHVAWTNLLDFERASFSVFASESPVDLIIGIHPLGPITPGAELGRLIPAGSASSLTVPSAFGTGDESDQLPPHWEAFDPDEDYFFSATPITETTFVTVGRVLKARPEDAPELVSATIDLGTEDELAVVWDRNVIVPSTTGLSLTSPSRTITSLLSGNNTPNHVYQLSAGIDEEDEPSFVIGNNRALQTLNGVRPATGTHAISVTGAFETSDLTGRTLHLRADLGNGSLSDGGAFASWVSQVGSITYAQATGGSRPVLDVDGVHSSLPSCNSDGSDDFLTTATTLSTLVGGAGDNYYIAGILRASGTLGTGLGYNANAAIISDPAGWWALLLHDLGAGASELVLYHYDTTIKTISSANGGAITAGRITTGTDFHFAVRCTGGSLRTYINGVLTNTLGSVGALSASGLASSTQLLRAYTTGNPNPYLQARLHELVFCNPDPGDTEHAQLMAYYDARLGL